MSESDQRPTAQDSAVGAPAETADTVLQALERGTDLSTELEATAAGLGGGGGADGGSSFVQLLRIVEGVDPLAYDYAYTAPDLLPDLQSDPLVEVPEEPEVPAVSIGVTVGTGIGVGGDGSGLITGDIIKGTVSTVDVVEGSGGGTRAVTFLITLDKVSSTDVTVTYTIVPGSASRPDDFNDGAITGTITIPAGYIGFSLTENIVEDTLVEGNETFTIVLSNPVGATLVNDTATVTIIDDDLATVSLRAFPADITEVGGEVTYTATLTGATFSTDVTVTLSNGQVITIAAGQTSGSVGFTFVPSDDVYVDPSSVGVVIDSVNAGVFTDKLTIDGTPATVSIADTIDTTTLTLNDVTVNEGSGTASITASLNNAPQTALTVTLNNGATITFGTDYVAGTLVSSTAFPINNGEDVYMDGSSFTLNVTGTVGGNFENLVTTDTATVTVTDTIQTTTVSVSTTNVTEADGSVTFTFQLSNPPQNTASLTVQITGETGTRPVSLNASGFGTLTLPFTSPTANVTATVTAITGGNFEATSIANATATADIDYTPDVTVSSVAGDETDGLVSAAGTLTVDWGGDSAGAVVLSATDATWSVATNTLTANNNSWKIVLTNGTYTFTQLTALTHTNTLDPDDDFTINVTATATDADGTVGSAMGFTVTVDDDGPRFTIVNDGADDGTVINVSAPNSTMTYNTQLADWKFGTDGAQGVPTLSGVTGAAAINIAASTSSSMVIDLKDGANVVGKLTLNADGTDSLQVFQRAGQIVFTPVAATLAKAGGPEGGLLVDLGVSNDFNIVVTGSDGDNLLEIGSGNDGDDLVNTSNLGWAVKGDQAQTIEQNESIKFSFVKDTDISAGYGVGDFKFTTEGYTGGLKIATITVKVYLNASLTNFDQVTIDATSGQVLQISSLDWTETLGNSNYVLGAPIFGVEIISAEADGSFRVNGVEVGVSSNVPPADLSYNFTLNLVDGDGDAVAQSFSVHLDGDATGTLVVEAIAGTSGPDTLTGTGANDVLIGGGGDDTLTGGLGADTFKWNLNETGSDKITDFNLGIGGDVLDLKDLLVGEHFDPTSLEAYLHFSVETSTGKTVITVDANAGLAGGTGQTITLTNVDFSEFQTTHGTTDAAIITKLIADGNLKTDI
ncbi:immunoglobulin-like domain-containing protein [Rhodoferax sp.]|uniref:immunoglobulin-like domain-containing protein n=1 Tax=Rhodoferax sp. TaxID=50421 RepID=UPI00273038C9|nr:immunoglobulin-like domain-containing protein [Rhodoferax sp.]MDP1942789.1 type I secretion C-terminal target domain-containing protein [Rhodoferax sp.]MDP2442601.1 type I secretion C-terminal target domain-containing protein [Rhodoferax sp.]